MIGRIYAKGKCQECGGKFEKEENDLVCRVHRTRPKRFYIQLRSNQENVHSDRNGNPFSSYEHANRTLSKIRVEIDEGTFDISRYVSKKIKPLRFSNWSKAWLQRKEIEAQKGLRSPAYLKTLRVYLYKFQGHFGNADIRDIGTKAVNDLYLSLAGSPKYIKNIMDGLEKMLHDAFDWEDIRQMPKFPKIEIDEPDIKTIDLDQQDAIIQAIADAMDKAYILFMAREMVRPSEVRALCWDDLDFKHDKVTIRKHFSLNQLRPTTKARQIKILPLDSEIKEALAKLPRHITSPFVFQKKGHPYSESWARKVWKKVSLTLGFNISLYQGTRHSSATELAERMGLDLAQQFLHHTTRAMTKRYAKQSVESLRKGLRATSIQPLSKLKNGKNNGKISNG